MLGSSAPINYNGSTACPARLYVLNDIALLQQYQGQSINVVVVYSNYPSSYRKVYINGIFSKALPFNQTLFNVLRNSTLYLGAHSFSTTSMSTVGLDAQFTEFQIYFGELSQPDAQSLFLIGTDPSHITISSSNTLSDINLSYYSTSLVNMNIQFLGGSPGPTNSSLSNVQTSFLFEMFGSETSFQLIPVDQQCTFNPIFSLNPLSSSTQEFIPAMNYTIVLLDSNLPAPEFSSTSCPNSYTPCYCGASKSPYQYMSDANLLNQSFVITEVNSTLLKFQYLYRTGLCYEVVGSEQFSLTQGQANSEGDSCFAPDVFFMNKTDSSSLKSNNLSISLFERYPEGVTWFTLNNQNQYVANTWNDPPMVNWFMENSTLTVFDQISGNNVVIQYSTTLVKSCTYCHTAVPIGNVYTMTANFMFPSFPYDLQFNIYAKRSASDGIFTVNNTWYIPVVGVMGKEVPNFYPVSSDPNLIFLILRDPPGGNSQTTIASGTSITFGVSIENMQTYDTSLSVDSELTFGAGANVGAGFIAYVNFLAAFTGNAKSKQSLKVSSARGSSSSHDYTFDFEYDFSTSADAHIAGK